MSEQYGHINFIFNKNDSADVKESIEAVTSFFKKFNDSAPVKLVDSFEMGLNVKDVSEHENIVTVGIFPCCRYDEVIYLLNYVSDYVSTVPFTAFYKLESIGTGNDYFGYSYKGQWIKVYEKNIQEPEADDFVQDDDEDPMEEFYEDCKIAETEIYNLLQSLLNESEQTSNLETHTKKAEKNVTENANSVDEYDFNKEETEKPVVIDMVEVKGGTFQMGSMNGTEMERPVHDVTVKSFLMGKTQVTQDVWQNVMAGNPSYFEGKNYPVECVSWYDAAVFCNLLSMAQGLEPCYSIDGSIDISEWGSVPQEGNDERWDEMQCNFSANGYRLPTEEEWEYAAREGEKHSSYIYSGSNELDEVAWYGGSSGDEIHDVAHKKANALGIYDMSGNVCEWCNSWYKEYGQEGKPKELFRVYRGGCFWNVASVCTVSWRGRYTPGYKCSYLGLRLVRTIK